MGKGSKLTQLAANANVMYVYKVRNWIFLEVQTQRRTFSRKSQVEKLPILLSWWTAHLKGKKNKKREGTAITVWKLIGLGTARAVNIDFLYSVDIWLTSMVFVGTLHWYHTLMYSFFFWWYMATSNIFSFFHFPDCLPVSHFPSTTSQLES